jgi:hypothetical protein
MIAKFMATGSYHEGTIFSRSEKISVKSRRPYWSVTCPICSGDEYTRNGLCTGTFTVTGDNLRKGYIPCRCGDKPNFTEEQWLYRINKRLLDKGEHISFVRIDKNGGISKSRLHLHCEYHGDFDMVVNGFMYTEGSCPSCAKTGFSKALPAHLYVLRIEGLHESFTGFGISNRIEHRLNFHKKTLAKYGLCVTETRVFPCSGTVAYEIENLVSEKFPLLNQGISGFIREATHLHYFSDVVDLVDTTLRNKIDGNIAATYLGQ